MRALIIDDEFLARQRLHKLLEGEDDVRVVGEAKNGKEALVLMTEKKPDLIFLDVRMPEMDGLELMSKIDNPPFVIFTTAYDQYALKAFEAEALDYLLKPFDEERLSVAVDRARKQVDQRRSVSFAQKMSRFVKHFEAAESQYLEEVTLRERGREVMVLIDEVMWIESDGNYVRLVAPKRAYLHRASLNELTEQLDPSRFLRIHRSYTINVNAVRERSYRGNNEYAFWFADGKELTSGRSYKGQIDEYLNDQ